MAQDAARQKSRELLGQQVAPLQVPPGQSPQLVLAQPASLPELPGLESWVAQTQASQSRVREQVLLGEPGLALLALPPLAGAPAQPEEQEEPPRKPAAFAKRPSPPLLLPNARLPPRIPRPLHLANGA